MAGLRHDSNGGLFMAGLNKGSERFCTYNSWIASRLAVLYRTGFCRRGASLTDIYLGCEKLHANWGRRLAELSRNGWAHKSAALLRCHRDPFSRRQCRLVCCPWCYASDINKQWRRLVDVREPGDVLYGLRADTALSRGVLAKLSLIFVISADPDASAHFF
jgi:hypothetical protein